MITSMLVRWVGGWTEVNNFDNTSARREATLGLGAQQAEAEALRVATEQLKAFADHRTEVAADHRPMGAADMPWIAYRVGDHINADDWYGTPTDQRVTSIGANLDDNGTITFSVELQDRILGERERAEQAMKKMTNGTLRGASKVATPTGMVGKRQIPPPAKGGGGN